MEGIHALSWGRNTFAHTSGGEAGMMGHPATLLAQRRLHPKRVTDTVWVWKVPRPNRAAGGSRRGRRPTRAKRACAMCTSTVSQGQGEPRGLRRALSADQERRAVALAEHLAPGPHAARIRGGLASRARAARAAGQRGGRRSSHATTCWGQRAGCRPSRARASRSPRRSCCARRPSPPDGRASGTRRRAR